MKTTIKFFAALFILLIGSNLQAQNLNNGCAEVEMQIEYQGDDHMACYDVYVYTSQIVSSITINNEETCTDTDMCAATLCFERQDEAYEIFIDSGVETDNDYCRSARVGSVVTIAP